MRRLQDDGILGDDGFAEARVVDRFRQLGGTRGVDVISDADGNTATVAVCRFSLNSF